MKSRFSERQEENKVNGSQALFYFASKLKFCSAGAVISVTTPTSVASPCVWFIRHQSNYESNEPAAQARGAGHCFNRLDPVSAGLSINLQHHCHLLATSAFSSDATFY